ncbi:hypothetical protein PHMEG_00014509 [Phytophthora megakarya]|uniref:Uncharacterized protein n=1 Tax=Phytophthora megakarya TaxID=4795 RepID=A0A225W463_9STRA|nr:hypothetical protein PHMEG_00014509 [Phytophthora megakarya]
MVRVPGSSGDSGFHRESQEDVKAKEEHREEVPTNAGSTEASLNTARSTDQRSMERISADRHETDLDQDPDLEEKPRIPLKTAAAVTTDLDENLDPYTTDKDTTKSKPNLSTKSVASTRSFKKKKIKAARTKLKAPDAESEDVHKPRSTIANVMIEQAYYRKILSETLLHDPVLAIMQVRQIGDLTGPISKPSTSSDRLNAVKILLDLLQEAGLVAGEFDPDSLFEMELGVIQAATQDLYGSLKILVGKRPNSRSELPDRVVTLPRNQIQILPGLRNAGSTAGGTKSNPGEARSAGRTPDPSRTSHSDDQFDRT